MNLYEALEAARDGHFVTNEYFSSDQSLHWYDWKYYYEDGAVVPEEFLENQDFAVNGKWRISIKKQDVDLDKLKAMHDKNKGCMLQGGSYMDCKK